MSICAIQTLYLRMLWSIRNLVELAFGNQFSRRLGQVKVSPPAFLEEVINLTFIQSVGIPEYHPRNAILF
jgi:hypothetical protein